MVNVVGLVPSDIHEVDALLLHHTFHLVNSFLYRDIDSCCISVCCMSPRLFLTCPFLTSTCLFV